MLSDTKRIFGLAKPHWKLLTIGFLISTIGSYITLVSPYLTKILFDDILINKKLNLFFMVLTLYLVVFIAERVFSIFESYITRLLVERINKTIRVRLFEHLEKLDIRFYSSRRTGDLTSRFGEVGTVYSYITTVLSTITSALKGVAILVISLSFSLEVTIMSMIVFPIYIFSQKYFVKRIAALQKSVLEKGADLSSFLIEKLSSIKIIQAFSAERKVEDDYQQENDDMIKLNIKNSLLNALFGFVNAFVLFIPSFVVLFYGGYQVLQDALTVGALIALTAYMQQFFGPIFSLTNVNVALKTSRVSINRVFEILDTQPNILDNPNAKPLKVVKGNIILKNLSFSYDGKNHIIDGIDLEINPGEKVAVVGQSGCGKSTLSMLLCRFYDPLGGQILIDGQEIRDVRLKSIRENIGLLTQDPFLFATTIKENIRFGKPEATDEEVMQAAKLAGADDFIKDIPTGYNTITGERGATLSDGQKQKIALARLILKNPAIWILDEATSAIDSESEEKLQRVLKDLTKGKTAITISHRLSSLKNADKVVVIKDHKIVEVGTFDKLLKKRGEFYKLYKNQVFAI